MKTLFLGCAAVLVWATALVGCSDDSSGGASGSGGSTGTSSTATGSGGEGTGGFAPLNPVTWTPLPSENAPSARALHTAVWTGSKMIVWGGRTYDSPEATASGAIYDPATKTWTPTSMTGAPAPRLGHAATWTGSKMLIWGGFGAADYEPNGAAYDPATDTWSPMASAGQPGTRLFFGAAWTGSVWAIWGGARASTVLGDGATYDPSTDQWTSMPGGGAPSKRFNPAFVWTGTKIVSWSGYDFFDWFATGAYFDPSAGTWGPAVSQQNAPPLRDRPMFANADGKMMVWGGWNGGPYLDTGGVLDPEGANGGTWSAMSDDGAPSPRAESVAVWTGEDFFVWGGCGSDLCAVTYGDGARYQPGGGGGKWTAIPTQAGLSKRRGATAVVTGTAILVWGGRSDENTLLGDGAEASL